MTQPYLATSLPDHQLSELYRLMTEEIKEVAVFFTDPHGIITVWNRGAEEMKGYTAEDAIGQPLATLYTLEDRALGRPAHNLHEAELHGFYREETWRRRKDGSLFWARIALTALRDASGVILGFSKITMDFTDHKRLESCVKEREETKRILRTANAGTWTWHPATDEIEVCENFLHLLGHDGTGTTMPFRQWLAFIEPGDQARVVEQLHATRVDEIGVLADGASPVAPLAMEMRMHQKSGGNRWFYVHADWHRETAGDAYVLTGVNVDIQAMKTAGEELRLAMEKLRDADARKDEFLAMLAHELRNPLAPIRSAAELLRIAQFDEARVLKTSEIIARQVGHMTSLVDDLLDVSRVTRGQVELDQKPLDLRHIVTDAVEQVSPLVRTKRQNLTLALLPQPTCVMGDKKRLVQIVSNLLNNAAKYTPDEGAINLMTEVVNNRVVLRVNDNGIGMVPALAARVFDLFAQAERTPDRSSGGLGLGLALVKSLVDLHGGTVSCASPGLGQGSTFSITLPLMQSTELKIGPVPPDGNDAHAHAHALALQVLIVDDNVDAAQMMAMFLEVAGHAVMVEFSAGQALARARVAAPDVCLLDIGLPDIDGLKLARLILSQPENAGVTLIAVTGYGQDSDRNASRAAGFKHHLVKPVDPVLLETLLADIDTHRSADPH